MSIGNRITLFLALCCCNGIIGDEHTHMYDNSEEVVLWMNTVGPYHNRQETYSYFSLPFCAGPKETLGEALQGTELEFSDSGLYIDFRGDLMKTEYCTDKLTEEKYQAFVYAVKNHYWYQMYIDDLPIWGIVGEIDEKGDGFYILTNKKFDIGYNEKQIVDVNLTSENKVKLEPGVTLSFSYEMKWSPSSIKYEKRFDKYFYPNFFPAQDKAYLLAIPDDFFTYQYQDKLAKVCEVVSDYIDQDWMLLYRRLPFHPKRGSHTIEKDISDISIERARAPIRNKAAEALKRWRRHHTRAKASDIIDALKRIRRHDVVHRIENLDSHTT